jgi:hypothetical protein
VSLAEGCCVTPQPVADAALLANPRGMVLLKSAVLFFFLPNASADTCVMILLVCVCVIVLLVHMCRRAALLKGLCLGGLCC